MKRYACLSILSLLATAAWSQDLPTYTCLQTTRPLLIDGKGDEAAWQQAAPISLVDVRFLSGDRFHSRPTEVRLLWDDDQLYVLFVATDPDVWSTLADRDDPLWDQEVVEIFFDPDGDGLNYVEIEVNPLNTIVDLLLSKAWGLGGEGYFEWSPGYETAVHVEGTLNDPSDEDRYWSVELALPWEILRSDVLDVPGDRSLPPLPGDQWRFNFYRYERIRADGEETGIEYSAWSPTGQVNFHMPERFGIVVFAPTLTAAEPITWGRIKTGRATGR